MWHTSVRSDNLHRGSSCSGLGYPRGGMVNLVHCIACGLQCLKKTPLHAAAQKGHKEVAALLLEKGAKVDAATDVSVC
jgi:hypothetical protein